MMNLQKKELANPRIDHILVVMWTRPVVFNNRYMYWEKRGPKINIMSFCRCDNKYIYIVKWGKRASKNIFIENNVIIFNVHYIFDHP